MVCRVLNHGTQQAVKYLPDLPTQQWLETFDTNIHSFFYLCKVGGQLENYERTMLTTAWVYQTGCYPSHGIRLSHHFQRLY